MPDPQTPTTFQITLAQLISILGAILSPLGLLIGYLWTLLTERVKRTETRLDEGASTMHAMKLDTNTIKGDVDHIVVSIRDHYKSSDEYRTNTDDDIHMLDKKVDAIQTRCAEREKAGKP
jgi:hypothetical protein